MRSKIHHVYARCTGRGPEQYLQAEFRGTRSQCETYLRAKARWGLPTQAYFISCLNIDRASRRYLP